MAKSLYRSFAGGEITPELFGRLDLPKFQTGLRKALNFITLPHGPAARRPGLMFINEARDSTRAVRLIPFVFNANQAVQIEFGHLYVRFHTSSGTVLEAAKTVTAVAGNTVTVTAHGYVIGDDIFLAGRYLRVASVPTANTFTVVDRWGAAVTPTGATTAARAYVLASPYSDTDLPTLDFAQDSDVLTITTQGVPAKELRRAGATNWSFTSADFSPPAAPGTPPGLTQTAPSPGPAEPQTYVYTYVLDDGVTESLPSPSDTVSTALQLAGNYNTISWSSIVGAARYYVYKQRGGIFGFIGQTTGTSIVDNNILPDTTITPPTADITLNTVAGDYPASVTYHERRRWFAGTANKPQNIWATRNGTQSNLTSSVPSRDDDALEFRIAAQQQNAIRHLIPLSDLVAFTVGGEFRIFSDGGAAITPTTLSTKPQGFSGSDQPQPVLTTQSALYVQAQGSRVRELAYDPSGTGFYRSTDVSLLATHLFNNYTVKELAYTRAPESVLWAIRSDGIMLGMSYVPDQQVFGWHQHQTDGVFESCAVIPENNEDVLYVVVRRTIDGRDVRYIERLTSRQFANQASAFFVDAGLSYSGAPITTVSGLWHLEGEAVQILADGSVVLDKTVQNGSVTLDTAASVVQVGKGYLSDLVTLALAYEGAPASGQGTMKNVSKVYMRVVNSSVIKAGPSFSKLREYPARAVSDPYGSPPSLQTLEAPLSIDPNWSTDGSVCVRQDLPLPLTVAAMALDTAIGG